MAKSAIARTGIELPWWINGELGSIRRFRIVALSFSANTFQWSLQRALGPSCIEKLCL